MFLISFHITIDSESSMWRNVAGWALWQHSFGFSLYTLIAFTHLCVCIPIYCMLNMSECFRCWAYHRSTTYEAPLPVELLFLRKVTGKTTTTTTTAVTNSSTNQYIMNKKTNKTGKASTTWWVPFQLRCQGQQPLERRSQEGKVWESLKEGLSSDGLYLHHINLTRQ